MRPPGPGPGRPPGSTNALPHGAVGAIKALRCRVPAETPEPLAEIADEAFATVVGIMRCSDRGDRERLTAARIIREEVCGPIAQKVAVEGGVTIRVVTGLEGDVDDGVAN